MTLKKASVSHRKFLRKIFRFDSHNYRNLNSEYNQPITEEVRYKKGFKKDFPILVSNQKEATERFMFKYYNNKPIKNNYNIPGTISKIIMIYLYGPLKN
jgi:hypothetical protein